MILACIFLIILELLGIIYLALCCEIIIKEMITLRADTEFLKDLHSKNYAEKTADLESAKKLIYENRT